MIKVQYWLQNDPVSKIAEINFFTLDWATVWDSGVQAFLLSLYIPSPPPLQIASPWANCGRLVETAMKNRPASRSGIGLQTPVSVADR